MVFAKNRKRNSASPSLLDKKNKPNINFETSNGRIYILVGFIFLAIVLLVAKLYYLQVSSHEAYQLLAEDQHTIFQTLVPKRGEIFLQDRDGVYAAAVNKETKLAYAVPKEIENPQKAAFDLAPILQMDAQELLGKLNKPEDGYELLKHRLSDEEIEKIKELNSKGIHLADENYRYYPSGELASNVLGFVGWQGDELLGRYGIEASFEKELKGQEGTIFQNRDTSGRWISTGVRNLVPAKNGVDLVLTIDHIIQYETEKILKSAVEKFDAESGSIIVMEPSTGKILAMADYPTFNPNNYSQVENIDVFRNHSVSAPYECGSVYKAVTMAAGIDGGKISPDTTYVDTGSVQEAGYTIKNSQEKVYGKQTMTGVLENSINTGVIYVEKQLGNNNFLDYIKRFGFGDTTDISFLNESAGNISNLKNLKSDIQFFTASFGQGITVTPIQLISAYNALANGGVLMKPQIVDKIISDNGNREDVIAPTEVRRVISQSSADQVTKMLRSVVTNGHGKQANVPGYLVCGKTGTAQVASSTDKGYEEGKTEGSFAGFAPMDNPKFSVLVKMDNPKAVQWAESSAAPTFGELMKFLLEYYNIEPTEDYTQKDLETFNATHDLKTYFMKKEGDPATSSPGHGANEVNKNAVPSSAGNKSNSNTMNGQSNDKKK